MKRNRKNKGIRDRIKLTQKDWYQSSDTNVDAEQDNMSNNKSASHLKESGKGLFNEVSFNVLENAAAQSKQDQKKRNGFGYTHKSVSSSDEVLYGKQTKVKSKHAKKKSTQAKSQAHQKNRSKTIVVTVILSLVVLFAVIGVTYYSEIFGSIQNNSSTKILINNIASNDIILIRMDEFLSQNMEDARVEDYYIEQEDLEDAKKKLEDLRAQALEIQSSTEPGDEENHASTNAIESIDCRLDMLECGQEIIKLYKHVNYCLHATDEFWNDLLDANDLLIEADEKSSTNTAHGIEEAIVANQKAIEHLNNAIKKIESLSDQNLKYDFSDYLQYAKTRLEGAQASLSSLTALLAQDTDTSIAQNDIYVKKDSEAADLAEKIDSNPTAIIRANYDVEIKPYIDKYKKARARAATVDSLIRNYLKV